MRLPIDRNNNGGSFRVDSEGKIIVTDIRNSFTGKLFKIEFPITVNLTKDHDERVFTSSLAGNFGFWIDGETGIEDSIGNIVAELVRVATSDIF